MAGGGVRRRFVPLSGEHHSLLIAPGVDIYFVPKKGHDTILGDSLTPGRSNEVLGGDVDLIWQHRPSDRFDGMLGLKLGAGISLFHQGGLPLIAFFAGCRI